MVDEPAIDQVPEAEQNPVVAFPLTRMIYCVGVAFILNEILAFGSWLLLQKELHPPFGLSRFDFWLLCVDLSFLLSVLAASMLYDPKFAWCIWRTPSSEGARGFKSIVTGLVGGIAALALASPVFWFVPPLIPRAESFRSYSIETLIARAFSPLCVLELIFFVIALALGSEVLFRGIVLRTLEGCASRWAAIFGSTLLFAAIYPVLDIPTAIILGIASAMLYQRTRNLLAPSTANAIFITGGAAIRLYHAMMR